MQHQQRTLMSERRGNVALFLALLDEEIEVILP